MYKERYGRPTITSTFKRARFSQVDEPPKPKSPKKKFKTTRNSRSKAAKTEMATNGSPLLVDNEKSSKAVEITKSIGIVTPLLPNEPMSPLERWQHPKQTTEQVQYEEYSIPSPTAEEIVAANPPILI